MFNKIPLLIYFILISLPFFAQPQLELTQGMAIRESVTIKPGVYNFHSKDLDAPVITIEGNNITIDFNNSIINGNLDGQMPNEFKGLGILIKSGKNIIIKNLQVKGFKVALMAQDAENLEITDSDFSYNYRMKLYSIRERENFQDWLSYHNNENDEWLRYGAGIYLKGCNNALVKNVHITQNQNALLMKQCNNGLFYNNTFHFNSGLGIGMYRSSGNRIMHNILNFNIRGHSEGFYNRGQDSAGILVYEQSNNNTFAYNSATHSGDGFFLWAGNHTMDTGEGGCNGNLLYGNDFSYAPTNGVEVTFSSNKIINNKLVGCRYGIWGGYSFNSYIAGNEITDNDYGIAIEHGQDNAIEYNLFKNNDVGIQLWERLTQPGDWGYANKRDVQSRDYYIRRNVFVNDSIPLKISGTTRVAINDDNQFINFKKLLVADKPNERFYLVKNDIYNGENLEDAPKDVKSMNRILQPRKDLITKEDWYMPSLEVYAPEPLPDAMQIPENQYFSRAYMRINAWGPYNYEYPEIWLKSIENETYTFALLGPSGAWKVNKVTGLKLNNSAPDDKIIGQRVKNVDLIELELSYTGPAFTDQFGEEHPAGKPYTVRFSRYERRFDWQVQWHAYDDASDPLLHYDTFKNLKQQQALKTGQSQGLAYVWWGKPAEEVPADRFATFAKTSFHITKGKYKIMLTSDDGVKLYLDGKLLIDRWDVHESTVDEIEVMLNGRHTIEIEHFDAGGLANLDFQISPAR